MSSQGPLRLAQVCVLVAASSCSHAPRPLLEDGRLIEQATRRINNVGMGDIHFDLTQARLPSGLQVSLERTPARGMVTVVLTVGAGSAADPAGKEGLAHLLEHLAFRSQSRGAMALMTRLLLMGATGINATTAPDRTMYLASVPAANLRAALQVFAALLQDPLMGVTEADLGTEREIVRNEAWERDETGVPGQLRGWIHRALFPADHAYVKPPGGTLASIDALSLADLQAFARSRYRPSNATLTLVGDVDGVKRAEELAEQLLPAEWKRSDPTAQPDPPLPALSDELPRPPAAGYDEHTVNARHHKIVVAWRLPPIYGELGHYTKAIGTSAGFRQLVYRLRLVEDVRDAQVWTAHYHRASVLVCQVELNRPDDWKTVAAVVMGSFALWMLERPIEWTPGKLLRFAQIQALANNPVIDIHQKAALESLAEAEPFSGRAVQWAEFMQAGQESLSYAMMLSRLIANHATRLSEFAREHLDPARARIIHLQPGAVPPPPASGPPKARVDVLAAVAARPEALPTFDAPPAVAIPTELARVRRATLENGLSVVVVPRAGFSLVTTALAFRGGGTGAPSLEAHRLQRYVESQLDVSASLDWIDARTVEDTDLSIELVRAGSQRLSTAFYALGLRLRTSADLEWEKLLSGVAGVSSDQNGQEESAGARLTRQITQRLYPGTPFGRVPDPAAMRRLRPGTVRDWTRVLERPDNAVLLVVGDVEPGATIELARRWFGGWKVLGGQPPRTPEAPPIPPAVTGRTIVIDAPNQPQVEIDIACRLPRADERGDAVHRLLAAVVGGWLQTRLRHEAGLSYGVAGGSRVLLGGGAHMLLTMTVDRRHLDQATRIVFGHWAELGTNIDTGAVSQARWNLATNASLHFQTTAEEALSILGAVNHGWALDHEARLPQRYLTVTPGDLAAAFATCRETTVFGLLGDEPTIREALRKHTAP